MPIFSQASKKQIETLHKDLQEILFEAIRFFDFSVIEGHRGKEKQEAAFAAGYSKVRWPKGKHNSFPSRAVDIAPYPIDWKNTERFVLAAGFILCIARQKGIPLRWGGDWDSDDDTRDEKFRDFGHFELV